MKSSCEHLCMFRYYSSFCVYSSHTNGSNCVVLYVPTIIHDGNQLFLICVWGSRSSSQHPGLSSWLVPFCCNQINGKSKTWLISFRLQWVDVLSTAREIFQRLDFLHLMFWKYIFCSDDRLQVNKHKCRLCFCCSCSVSTDSKRIITLKRNIQIIFDSWCFSCQSF